MTGQEIKERLSSTPFLPFTVYLADGRQFEVTHPEIAWQSPGGRLLVIAVQPDGLQILDILMITGVAIHDGHAKRQPRSK